MIQTRTTRHPVLVGLTVLLAMLVATAVYAHLEVDKTMPADGATVAKLDMLRVWFNQEPDVALSKLELEGPNGSIDVENVHSMGEKDLMGQVMGKVGSGKYTAKWQTAGHDGHVQKGEWTFTVE